MDSFKRAQAAYDAMLPPEYWDSGPCDYCKAVDCYRCEHRERGAEDDDAGDLGEDQA